MSITPSLGSVHPEQFDRVFTIDIYAAISICISERVDEGAIALSRDYDSDTTMQYYALDTHAWMRLYELFHVVYGHVSSPRTMRLIHAPLHPYWRAMAA